MASSPAPSFDESQAPQFKQLLEPETSGRAQRWNDRNNRARAKKKVNLEKSALAKRVKLLTPHSCRALLMSQTKHPSNQFKFLPTSHQQARTPPRMTHLAMQTGPNPCLPSLDPWRISMQCWNKTRTTRAGLAVSKPRTCPFEV
jgi:hypothetical protein